MFNDSKTLHCLGCIGHISDVDNVSYRVQKFNGLADVGIAIIFLFRQNECGGVSTVGNTFFNDFIELECGGVYPLPEGIGSS